MSRYCTVCVAGFIYRCFCFAFGQALEPTDRGVEDKPPDIPSKCYRNPEFNFYTVTDLQRRLFAPRFNSPTVTIVCCKLNCDATAKLVPSFGDLAARSGRERRDEECRTAFLVCRERMKEYKSDVHRHSSHN